jgi:hypothetical protein
MVLQTTLEQHHKTKKIKIKMASDDESLFTCWPHIGLNNLLYWYNRLVQTN